MTFARAVVTFSEPVTRLRKNPLIETITDNTHILKGGWANGLIFVPDPSMNKCVIIDPGISKDLERQFRAGYVRRIRAALSEVLNAGDTGTMLRIVSEKLSVTGTRLQLLRDLNKHMDSHDIVREPHDGIFAERVAQITGLIERTGLEVDAILATHHHIDHFGSAAILRDRLGVKEKILMPDPGIFEGLSTSRRGDLWVVNQASNSQPVGGIEKFGIRAVDISGHTTMLGFLFPDNVLLVGDLVATENLWEHTVMYIEDVLRHSESLMRVLETPFQTMVLSHGTSYVVPHEQSMDLVRVNLDRVSAVRGIAWQYAHPIEAADVYLQSMKQELSPNYLGWVLVTAMSIGNYR